MINEANNTNPSNVDFFGTLEGENENNKSFNGSDRDRDGFMKLDFPWFLLCVIATDAEEN